MWFVLSPGRKERPLGPPPHVAFYMTTAGSRTCRGWGFPRLDRSLLSLPTLEHHLMGFNRLGALVNVDHQAELKVSSHAQVFNSLWAFQPVCIELVSRDCEPSLPLLSISLSLYG